MDTPFLDRLTLQFNERCRGKGGRTPKRIGLGPEEWAQFQAEISSRPALPDGSADVRHISGPVVYLMEEAGVVWDA